MPSKPPWFKFYAKDWRSSPQVRQMTREQRGLYIDLLALAWESEQPGTIRMTEAQICRELHVFSPTLRRFLADFPATFRRVDGDLVQSRLDLLWRKFKEISDKNSANAKRTRTLKNQISDIEGASGVVSSSSKETTTHNKTISHVRENHSNNGQQFIHFSGIRLRITFEQHSVFSKAFEGTNLDAEYLKMDSWLVANKRNYRSFGRFANSWLSHIKIPDTKGNSIGTVQGHGKQSAAIARNPEKRYPEPIRFDNSKVH